MDLKFEVIPAGVVESVDTTDLKSVAEKHTGSSPVPGTISFEQIEGIPWPHKCKWNFTEDTAPAPVWDTTKEQKDFCACGERSETIYQGLGFCDHCWYEWLCEDRGYDVGEPDEDKRFVATIFI